MTSTSTLEIKRTGVGKLAAAFVATVMAAMVAMTGAAGAASVPTSKADCKNGGWQDYGTMFKNQGQCVKYVTANNGDNGYNGGNTNVVNNNPNIFVDIKNAAVHTVNITINFVTNIFN